MGFKKERVKYLTDYIKVNYHRVEVKIKKSDKDLIDFLSTLDNRSEFIIEKIVDSEEYKNFIIRRKKNGNF